MKMDELLELLDIDAPEEFEYFEHLAELLECAEEISEDAFIAVLMEVDPKVLNELLETYFEDVLQGIPEDALDFFTLMSTIRQSLLGLSLSASDSDQRRFFAEELFRFRLWYVFDSVVYCKNKTGGPASAIPVFEALALYRLEKLGEEAYEYDFSEALDYSLDEYSISFPYSISDEDAADDEEFEEEDDETLIDKIYPVIDGEFSDDEDDEFDDEDE